jgi:hypothetical protein
MACLLQRKFKETISKDEKDFNITAFSIVPQPLFSKKYTN